MDFRSEIDDEFTRYFEGLGFKVTWDFNDEGKWYEIYDDDDVFVQVDYGVFLEDFLKDLPFFAKDLEGVSEGMMYTVSGPPECFAQIQAKVEASRERS